MTQPFADALTWVPKSRALGAALVRAHDLARAQSHGAVGLEHMLLALIEDTDAAALLLSCNIDLLGLNGAVSSYLLKQTSGDAEMPTAAPALVTILEYAVAAARQSKRTEINGAIVLAAIVGEGKSEAARLLLASGLKFEDAVQALRKANASRPATADVPAGIQPPMPQAQPATQGMQQAAPTAIQAPLASPPARDDHVFDDDPVTTARRRIDAIRNGQTPPPAASNGHAHTAAGQNGSDWAPSPASQPISAQIRPVRMPPPVPPVAEAPVRGANGAAAEHGGQVRAPWADGAAEAAGDTVPQRPLSIGSPIDTARLFERFAKRMQAGRTTTLEVLVARSSVLASANAARGPTPGGRDVVLTRALTVRLKAPAGGYHIENAAPETQWFDTRSTQRDDAEVRWRWQVTPQRTGNQPLQLSLTLRSIAADGMIVETALPEQQGSVRIQRDRKASLMAIGGWMAAALAGTCVALLVTDNGRMLIGRLLGY